MTRIVRNPGYAIFACLTALVLILLGVQSFRGRDYSSNALPAVHVPSSPSIPEAASSEVLVGNASVIDGDTIDIHGTRIRFSGIDAPESRQTCEAYGATYRCGQRAALALSDFIGAHTISCHKTGTDKYRRVIAKCFSNGIDLSGWMVSNGWAVAYRKYSMDYVADEERAHNQKLGIWAGTFIAPELWRKSKPKGE
ncbi:thermonuclease family protein [Bradyrhizobium sp. LB13.1]